MIILILPAYNEQDNIGLVLEDAHHRLREVKHTFIVVNDGSTDWTREVVLSYAHYIPVHLVDHSLKKGIRFAFMSGFQKAREISQNDHDTVVMLEADNTFDLRIMNPLMEKMEKGYDLVSASRFISGGRYVTFPPGRLLLSLGSNMGKSKMNICRTTKGVPALNPEGGYPSRQMI